MNRQDRRLKRFGAPAEIGFGALQQQNRLRVNITAGCARVFAKAERRVLKARIQLFEQRNDLTADFVARVVVGKVCAVGDKSSPFSGQ